MRTQPTVLLVALALLAGLPLLAPSLQWLSLALNLGLLVVAALDLLYSRRPIEAERTAPQVAALGAQNRVEVALRSPGRPLMVELKEDLPADLPLAGAWPSLRLQGGAWHSTAYALRPRRRGQYSIGPLHVRYSSPLGLWRRQATVAAPAPVRVYPNVSLAHQYTLSMRSGRTLEGLKRARLRGMGTEFESLREYQPGDQYRAINWPATARQGKLISTLYQVDRSQPVVLMIDAGRVMLPQVLGLAKLDHALNAALLLATVAAERGDQVGMLLFGGEVKAFLPPKKGRGQVLTMVQSVYAVQPEQVEPDYGRMIGWLRAHHKKRSLVVLFTDLIDPEVSRGLVQNLAALAAHHLVLLVCLSDPELLALSRRRPESLRQVYTQAVGLDVLSQREETKARLVGLGVMVIDVPPAEFSAAVVDQYLLIKEQGRL